VTPADPKTDEDLAGDLAHAIVARVAPAELRLFAVQREAYLAGVAPPAAGGARRGDPLAIGVGEVAVMLVTPVALAVATEVTDYLLRTAVRPAVGRAGAGVASAVRRLFRGRAEPPASGAAVDPADPAGSAEPPGPAGSADPAPSAGSAGAILDLAPADRERVHRIVIEVVIREGRPDDVARRIATAVTGVEPSAPDADGGR